MLARIGTICGNKPQRLLEEARRSAESRVLVAVGERSVTHGKPPSLKRIMVGVTIPRVTLRYTLSYEPLASLGLSTFQVVLRLFSGYAAVSRHHLMVMRLFGNFVAVKRRFRRGHHSKHLCNL